MSHDLERPNKVQGTTPSVEEIRSAVHPEKKSRLSRLGRGGQVAIAGAILAGIAGLGIAGDKVFGESSNNAPEPNPNPTAEAPVVPGEPEATEPAPVESEAPVEIAPETLRIPADLPAEELARASVELTTDWLFAGATEDTIEATAAEQLRLIQEEGVGFEQAFVYMAEENADYYSKAVMVDDWANNPEAVEFRQYMVDRNAKAIQVALTRHSNGDPLISWTVDVSEVQELETTENDRMIQYVSTITALNDESVPEPVRFMNTIGFDTDTGSALISDESSHQLDGFVN